MTRPKKTCVVALLAIQLFAGILGEALHSDRAIAGGGRGAELRCHDCGTRERHQPFEKEHDCPTCLLNAQRVTLQPPVVPGVGPMPFLIALRDRGQPRVSSFRPPTTIPRGPPAA